MGMASYVSSDLQDVGLGSWDDRSTRLSSSIRLAWASSHHDHVVPEAASKTNPPRADAAQISVCVTFAVVLLAKESLVAKPCLHGAGPSLNTGRGRIWARVCSRTDNIIKNIP